MNQSVPVVNREQVFEQLIDHHLPTIRRVVFRILGNAADTDDVIQQAMLKAWEKFDRCRNPEKIGAWVCRIAGNEAYDLLRRRRSETALFEARQGVDAVATGHDREVVEVVESAMQTLPEHLHSALNLTVFEDFSTDRAAATLGCTPATLYWRIFKARKILEKQLRELLK